MCAYVNHDLYQTGERNTIEKLGSVYARVSQRLSPGYEQSELLELLS